MPKKLNLRFFLILSLSLSVYTATWAKKNVVAELTLPILAYKHSDQPAIPLSDPGELVLTLEYWDTFKYPDNNSYSLKLRGYSNSSRSINYAIFNSHLPGASPTDVKRGQWNNATWSERQASSGEFTHVIWLTLNNLWETRCGFTHDGHIIITYGRLTDNGALNNTKLIFVDGGVETWNKLVNFLRNAHNHNIGKTI